ncbi:MAG: hypothetical protein Q8M54_06820, partial [Desulfobaccales bacterium]|nr:hypothetical protein [Desulfobaccales bacterium]
MCDSWKEAYRRYDWTVDLSHFNGAANYPGFFNRVILPADVKGFEDKFRAAIDANGTFEVAGEVCFWKNYGNFRTRNNITQRLLTYLSDINNWNRFCLAVKHVSHNQSYTNFVALQNACHQPKGFASPITFLAFYNPVKYPMVDKHIAYWWAKNKEKYGYGASQKFSQRNDGWIQTYTISQTKQNWDAYIEWKNFCNDY